MTSELTNAQIVEAMQARIADAPPRVRQHEALVYVQYDQSLNETLDALHDNTYEGALTAKDLVDARGTLDVTDVAWAFTDAELAEAAELSALDDLQEILFVLEWDLCLQEAETPGMASPMTIQEFTKCHFAILAAREGFATEAPDS